MIIANLFYKQKITDANPKNYIGYAIVCVSAFGYLSYAGFYDELPSDIYKHIEYFKQIAMHIEEGHLKPVDGLELFSKQAQHWYHLPTIISSILGSEFLANMEIFAFINVIVLLLCIYEFSNWTFEKVISNRFELLCLNLLSVFFFAAHFGINVFSFIRYYSIAPTILNFSLYLTAIICLFHYFRFEFRLPKFLSIAGLLFFTAYLLHAQEAMFIATIYILLLAIMIVKNYRVQSKPLANQPTQILPTTFLPLVITVLLCACVIYLYTVTQLPFNRINKPKIIDISKYLGIGEDNFILNPRGQLNTVLTHWGFYIYVLYILYYKKYFANQPFILAAMLVPILTVLNPFFTSFFLRISSSDVLWRFLYMVPLYLVAARLVVGLCSFVSIDRFKRMINSLIVISIFLLLFPIKLASIDLPYSRIYSLQQPHYQARASYWQDMLAFLQNLPDKEQIITDPVTGYLINSITKHRYRGYKFYKWQQKDSYLFEDYSEHPLKQYNGKLLIINRRKGMSTKAAKLAKHWPAHALKLTDYYSDELLNHLKDYPMHFKPVWQTEDIEIYRINY